eukprot:Blabericola_migrator_1__4340@NODE_2335_length_2918_cov_380_935812_g1461_i0_p1_GENE_NODE_2335_length_2918_cov_380_935812_g1461_i0NODE_2335_length_2918_cov_380_935812_g1461_i0_p1_ORF_typecomplete_len453_score62_22CDPOH_P_transf/PF01066_21/1_2e16CDPOH_P_transf/PF01066_21/3_1e03Rab5ip/PF07019_12/7_2e03Rab5ip/PF07019_12/0_26DUF2070/PF09843_9/1_3e03DUF2070/PF09843_9/0_49_NODE_2335_length_2918_cov_380_935812_g1461_i03601718
METSPTAHTPMGTPSACHTPSTTAPGMSHEICEDPVVLSKLKGTVESSSPCQPTLPMKLMRAFREPYLNRNDCEVLSQYKYHSVQGTKLDNILNKLWWTPLSNYIPLNIHPNTLTVAGLACSYFLSFLPLVLSNPTFDSHVPPACSILAAIGFFLYQTLDALDGKQARRTGLSSPMGQMMDHGCDSLTTFLSVFMCCATCSLGSGPLVAVQLTMITLQLYMYTWYEITYGIFRACTGEYCGVTEGQWIIILTNVLSAWRPSIWTESPDELVGGGITGSILGLLTLRLSLGTLAYMLGNAIVAYVVYTDFHEIMTTRPPPDKMKALKEWGQMGFHAYCNAALVLGGVMARQPQLTTTLITVSGSLLAWRLILSAVSKAKLRVIQWQSLPFYVTSLIVSCQLLGSTMEMVLLLLTSIWMAVALVSFIQVNMTIIRDYLGKPLFEVPASIKSKVN